MGTIDDDTEGAGKGWLRRKARRAGSVAAEVDRLYYSGLGERVEKILRLAEEEARALRDEAARASAQMTALIIEAANKDAERIRSEAEADARAIRLAAGAPPANP